MATNQDYIKALGFLLAAEGGYNNIPGDTGGPTNLGISLRFLQDTGDYDLGDLDHDGDIDIADIKLLDPDKAARIFKKYFWDYFPMKEIPAQIAYVLFDVAVNSGQKAAAKLLQAALGVTPDGIIGGKTLYSLGLISSSYMFAERMCTKRKLQYMDYAKRNHTLNKFLPGWLNRVDQIRKNLFEI